MLEKQFKSELNIAPKCRGCLTEEPGMNSLFSIYERNMSLANILEDTMGYEVLKERRDSKYLCRKCTNVICDFLLFKRSFEQATTYFETLKRSSQNKDEDDTKFCIIRKDEHNFSNVTVDGNIEKNKPKINIRCNPSIVEISRKNSNPIKVVRQRFNDKNTLSLQEHKETKETSCSLSGKKIISNILLQRHQRQLNRKKQRKNTMTQKKEPDVFIKSDTKELCKICKLLFTTEEFHLHFETHKIHVCNMCGHKFLRKTDLNDHEETHSNVCRYVCHHCGKAFKLRTALSKHKRIHTNPREEICDVCGQRFNTRDTLKTHYKLKHIKSKDFQCYLCGLAFSLKSTLEKHIERHNPNRKRIFTCKLCDVSYINKYNLSRHYVVKHTPFENKPTCEFCGKGYIKNIDLVKHLKKHHEKHNNQIVCMRDTVK